MNMKKKKTKTLNKPSKTFKTVLGPNLVDETKRRQQSALNSTSCVNNDCDSLPLLKNLHVDPQQ